MTQPQSEWNPGRAAGNTVVVLLVLVGVFCVLPALICLGIGLMGAIFNP